MKVTRSQLRRIIKEELNRALLMERGTADSVATKQACPEEYCSRSVAKVGNLVQDTGGYSFTPSGGSEYPSFKDEKENLIGKEGTEWSDLKVVKYDDDSEKRATESREIERREKEAANLQKKLNDIIDEIGENNSWATVDEMSKNSGACDGCKVWVRFHLNVNDYDDRADMPKDWDGTPSEGKIDQQKLWAAIDKASFWLAKLYDEGSIDDQTYQLKYK